MKCKTPHCRKKATKAGLCPACISRKWRAENPVRAAWLNLKHNSKRRGKDFDLSFEEFEAFAIRTGYMKKKGRFAESWHIDRIEEEKGYTAQNIQVLTNTKNVRKYLRYSWNGREMEYYTQVSKPQPALEGVPF